MTDRDAVRMSDQERDAFLESVTTGVLSLATATDEPPHSIPVSYGFDPAEGVFYFRLAVDPDSEKGPLHERPVSFVVYDEVDGTWKSVVAQGHLQETTSEDIELDSLSGLERVHIPLVDIFGEPTDNFAFEFYRLDPAVCTGRVETPVGE